MTDTLHDYQRVGVEYLRGRGSAGLFLDCGLGKTATALTALTDAHLPALVIAPKRVTETVWHAEAAKWRPDLRVSRAVGSAEQRATAVAAFKAGAADVLAISWDNMAEARLTRPVTLILDELSGYKSKGSARWRNANRLIKDRGVKQTWGLTGTPAPNGLLDLWAQVHLLDGGKRLGTNFEAYRNRYFEPGEYIDKRGKLRPAVTWINGREVVTQWVAKSGAAERIHSLIDDLCLSMTGEGRIKLPSFTHVTHGIDLPRSARAAYEEIKAELAVDLELIGAGVYTAANSGVLTSKLSQIAAGFLYPDLDAPEDPIARLHNLKTDKLVEIVEGTGRPILVFHRFKEELAAIQRALPQAWSINDKHSIDAWNAGDVPVLLAHPASAGHGLNIQHGGDTQVWTTKPWELELWEQGIGRTVRQGQPSDHCVIHSISATDTVDQAISLRLEGKATVQDALRAALDSPI